MSEWIKCSERLPHIDKYRSAIVLFVAEGKTYAGTLHANGWFYECLASSADYGRAMFKGRPDCVMASIGGECLSAYPLATLWQPLPEPHP